MGAWQGDLAKFEAQLAAGGLTIRDIRGDGNCMFRAIADQLEGNQEAHWDFRHRVMNFMEENRGAFEPFVEDDVPFDTYVVRMRRDSEWGGHLELQAISQCFGVNIIVHQLGTQPWEIQNFPHPARALHLSYHDGEHYASVRYADDTGHTPARAINLEELAAAGSSRGSAFMTVGVRHCCRAH
jgi:OTU domain-containing protein 3